MTRAASERRSAKRVKPICTTSGSAPISHAPPRARAHPDETQIAQARSDGIDDRAIVPRPQWSRLSGRQLAQQHLRKPK